MRVCVTGGRDFKDWRFVWRSLNEFEAAHGEITELGHGNAKGADTHAKKWAEQAGILVRKYEADWDRWGDSAGSIRNEEMLDDFVPDVLIVFPGGVGTQHATRAARKRDIERVFFDPPCDHVTALLNWG